MSDVLKEYLVSLGFNVNENKFNAAMGKLKGFEKSAGKVSDNMAKSMQKGATAMVAAIATATAGVVGYMESVAKADMETEKFARRMWMTEESARTLQTTLKAMGEDMNTLYDVAANAELRDQFMQLRSDASTYEGGSEVEKAMKDIRAVTFEFQRLKLIVSYLGRYVAYYLTQYLAEPMNSLKQKLKAFNDNGKEILSVWGKKVAKVLSWIVRIFLAIIDAIDSFIRMIRSLPGEMKIVASAIAAIAMTMIAPWTGVLMAIGAVLLLLEDFYTWKNGGQSLFGEMWSDLYDFQQNMTDFTLESKTWEELNDLCSSLLGLFDQLGEEWLELNDAFKEIFGLDIVQGVLTGIDELLSSILSSLTSLVDTVTGLLSGELSFSDLLKGFSKEDAKNGFFDSFGLVGRLFRIGPMANDSTRAAAKTTNNNVNNDNRMEMNNTFYVTGSEASSIAENTASEIDMLTKRVAGGWAGARVEDLVE